jgi:mono/diheme cytochrome c family protein
VSKQRIVNVVAGFSPRLGQPERGLKPRDDILVSAFGVGMRTFSGTFILIVILLAGTALAQHAFTPEEIAEGGRLFQSNCAGCHGSGGDQVQGVALMSGKFRRATTDDDVASIIRKGVPGTAMQAFNFTEQQAGSIVAYLRSFSGGSLATTAANAPGLGDAKRGKQLFEGKGNCLSCHRVGTDGSRVGPDLTSAGLPRPPSGGRFVGFGGTPPPPPTPEAIVSQLQRDLVDPDAEISPANRTFRAVLKDGSVVTGRLLNLDHFTVQLFDSKERLLTLQRSELREFGTMKSSMPSYRDKLTPPEMSDLLAYLVSLKGEVQ